MRHLIGWALRALLHLLLPARGQHRAAQATPGLAPVPLPGRQLPPEPTIKALPYSGPLVRPYVDWVAWREELREMEEQVRATETLWGSQEEPARQVNRRLRDALADAELSPASNCLCRAV